MNAYPQNPDNCQVHVTLDMFIGKWKSVILLHLLFGGTKRFSELKRLMPDITQRMLTLQLRELEEQDLIRRVVYPQVPPKVEYSVTEYGRTLMPILHEMHKWGAAHVNHMSSKRQQSTSAQTESGEAGGNAASR